MKLEDNRRGVIPLGDNEMAVARFLRADVE